jgi:hypothetical protein
MADQILENGLSGHQLKMTDEIRMSYSMLLEVEQMEKTYGTPKPSSPEPAAKDSPKVK